MSFVIILLLTHFLAIFMLKIKLGSTYQINTYKTLKTNVNFLIAIYYSRTLSIKKRISHNNIQNDPKCFPTIAYVSEQETHCGPLCTYV